MGCGASKTLIAVLKVALQAHDVEAQVLALSDRRRGEAGSHGVEPLLKPGTERGGLFRAGVGFAVCPPALWDPERLTCEKSDAFLAARGSAVVSGFLVWCWLRTEAIGTWLHSR